MATVSIRYIVNDIDAAIGFYTRHLGFSVQMHPNDMFAMLTRGELRLVLSVAGGGPGGGQAMPDGTMPTPGISKCFATCWMSRRVAWRSSSRSTFTTSW